MRIPTGTQAAEESEKGVVQELEQEVIGFFVRLMGVSGQPKSVGEIYGLLFISPEPLCMEDLMNRLRLSKGSVSQGLKTLRGFGAVRTEYVPGQRRDYFVAELEFRKIVAGFLREQVQPQLEGGIERIERVRALAGQLPSNDGTFLKERVKTLQRWERRAEDALPVLIKVLGL